MHPVELCALEVFRVKGHRAIRRDALAVMSRSVIISGSSQLLLECTALLSRSPPASAQQSPRLWCWGHTCSHTSVSQHNMSSERFHSWYSSQPITSAVEENALPCPGIEPKWVRSVCPNSTEMTTNKRLFTPHLLYYTGNHNVPFISFKTFLWYISLLKKKKSVFITFKAIKMFSLQTFSASEMTIFLVI